MSRGRAGRGSNNSIKEPWKRGKKNKNPHELFRRLLSSALTAEGLVTAERGHVWITLTWRRGLFVLNGPYLLKGPTWLPTDSICTIKLMINITTSSWVREVDTKWCITWDFHIILKSENCGGVTKLSKFPSMITSLLPLEYFLFFLLKVKPPVVKLNLFGYVYFTETFGKLKNFLN